MTMVKETVFSVPWIMYLTSIRDISIQRLNRLYLECGPMPNVMVAPCAKVP